MTNPASNSHPQESKVISTFKAANIAKNYGSRQILKDITVEFKSNEICCLLGPNGAGKTTLFYSMVGLIKPNSGKILLDDAEITNQPIHKRSLAGLSYLPQEASIYRKLTVKDNIIATLETQPNITLQQINDRCEQLLNEFHLGHIQNSKGISLSGGERRRTEIARALASSPKFLLLDEPFAGIDPISVIDIKQIIRKLKEQGIGILITDHNVRDTLDICDRAFIVYEGKIIASGTANEVMNNTLVKDVYLGSDFSSRG